MPKPISVEPHISLEELYERYRRSNEVVEKAQYQIIWLLAQGKKVKEVSQITGYSHNWIYTVLARYNLQGVAGLGDNRHNNPGGKLLLDDVQIAQLWQVLQEPAPDGGLWNGRKVADYLSELQGRRVSRQRGWEYLRAFELRLKVPLGGIL